MLKHLLWGFFLAISIFLLNFLTSATHDNGRAKESTTIELDVHGASSPLLVERELSRFAQERQTQRDDHHHRDLSEVDYTEALESFKAVPGMSLLGLNSGGTFSNEQAPECAARCLEDPDCRSFEIDTSIMTCYVSRADRFTHPQAFVSYAAGVYYEFHGRVEPVNVYPNGGRFHTHVYVHVETPTRHTSLRVKIMSPSTTLEAFENDTSTPLVLTAESQGLVLPSHSCKLFVVATRSGMDQSLVFESDIFYIQEKKYGYLVPFFNGQLHGKVVRLTLDVEGTRRPRPSQYQEFSSFESKLGIGPYQDQVHVVDLGAADARLKGFHGGFAAMSTVQYINRTTTYGEGNTPSSWTLLRKDGYVEMNVNTDTLVEQVEEYSYYIPYYDGTTYSGTIARIRSASFTSENPEVESMDLKAIHPDFCGFRNGFAHEEFGYLVPYKSDQGFSGKVVRFNLNDFSLTSVVMVDLTSTHTDLRGFSDAFTHSHYAYFVPFQYDHDRWGDTKYEKIPERLSGLVARIDLKDFTTRGVSVLDLTEKNSAWKGFSSGFVVGKYGYFVPFLSKPPRPTNARDYSPLRNGYSGHLVRVDLTDFDTAEGMELQSYDDTLRGFSSGFASGKYAVLVPFRNGITRTDHSGKYVRVDTTLFPTASVSSVEAIDLTTYVRDQIPNIPDAELRGFSGAFTSGKYAYFTPFFNGKDFSSKIARLDVAHAGGPTEIQELDLALYDPDLCGFMGGFTSVDDSDVVSLPLFGRYESTFGTNTSYNFQY